MPFAASLWHKDRWLIHTGKECIIESKARLYLRSLREEDWPDLVLCFRCIWQCPGQSLYHQCEAGQWSERPGVTRCLCPRIGEAHQGEVLCHPPVNMAAAVPSGTYCLHTCHGHTKTEMMCQHSLWSTSPASLSCEGTNSSSSPAPLRSISPRGKSLQLSQARPVTLRDQMGALADIKIAEMKTKDIFAKPMMKTKVSWSQLVNSMFY